ncbi:hypothetical protein COOONC_24963 [Cooperia oncophora]
MFHNKPHCYNCIDWENDKAVKGADMRFKEAFECCELEQWVRYFTRGESVLDLILSSGFKIGNFGIDYIKKESSFLAETVFRRVDYRKLSDCLNTVDWNLIFNNYTSFFMTSSLVLCLSAILGENNINTPTHIRNLVDQKVRLFRELKNPLSDANYKKVCSNISLHVKKYLAYCERKLLNRKHSSFFKYLKGKLNAATKPICIVNGENHTLNSDREMATALGNHFACVFTQPVQHLDQPHSGSKRV